MNNDDLQGHDQHPHEAVDGRDAQGKSPSAVRGMPDDEAPDEQLGDANDQCKGDRGIGARADQLPDASTPAGTSTATSIGASALASSAASAPVSSLWTRWLTTSAQTCVNQNTTTGVPDH